MLLKLLSDWNNPHSLMNKMRSRRLALHHGIVAPLPRPLRIIDRGGTVHFGEQRGWAMSSDVEITVINLESSPTRYRSIATRVGDACDLTKEFADQSFDLVFSNSVIEHVGDFTQKRRMALEVLRLAPRHWVETPNLWFPIEPHLPFPGWQWLPEAVRVGMLRRRGFGWNGRRPDPARARDVVRHAQLLSGRDLRRLFPGGRLLPERFLGLVKSWIVVGGFSDANDHLAC